MSSPGRAPVLVVDDEEAIRLFIRGALEDEGLLVETAASGREAQAVSTPPALVVLDLMLPDAGGETIAEQLRSQHGRQLPILVISADTHAQERAERVGAFACLHKPFDLDRLVDLVQQGLSPAR